MSHPSCTSLTWSSESILTCSFRPGVNTNFFRDENGSQCGCTDYASCHIPAGFYDLERFDTSRGIFDQMTFPPREYLSHWFTGCWPAEALLVSTLEHLYNQSALNGVLRSINASVNTDLFSAIPISNDSSFDPSTTIETLLEDLFVQTFSKQLNYTSYFQQCRPESCSIDINARASLLYIFTSLLGLYGGLSVVLFFATPHAVTWLMEVCQRRTNPAGNCFLSSDQTVDLSFSIQRFVHLCALRSSLSDRC